VTVDAVVEKICNLLTNSAKSTFGTYTKAKNIRNDTSKSKPYPGYVVFCDCSKFSNIP
jgi:hypothetical protein